MKPENLMSHGVVTLPLGLVLGLMLSFDHKSMKTKGVFAKIFIGLFAGLGIFVFLNGLCEIIGVAN